MTKHEIMKAYVEEKVAELVGSLLSTLRMIPQIRFHS